ncbi:MAG TPA: hypothetical protein VFC65_01765 [Prolixibacteraceae bacterium]|nr:hypothetical protein [Prolixibacteraceae bacterium]
MTENDVQNLIQSWENLALLVRYIADYPEYLDIIINKALDDGQPENWRAMWMVDKIHEKHPEQVLPYLPVLTEFLPTTTNSGKKRHLLKLISFHGIPEEKMACLLNYCIEVFTDAKEPVAVRVHAMQILFNIAQQEPDFAGELIRLIEHEMEYHGSSGITARGRKLLRKLSQISKERSNERGMT